MTQTIEQITESQRQAAIKSYKAELLKEVTSKDVLGEPVAYFSDEFFSINTKQNATFNDPLFTSDQVAAAVLKATKPLEDQLTAAQEEIERLRIALDCTKMDLVRMRWLRNYV